MESLQVSPRVIFDNGPLSGPTAFTNPTRIIRADAPEEVPAAFAKMDEARAQGLWLAGFCSYELGYVFSHKLSPLMPAGRDVPLVCFGVFDGPHPAQLDHIVPDGQVTDLRPMWSEAQYTAAFSEVRARLAQGDIYQANLTFPLVANYSGTPFGLYQSLRQSQPVPYGAFLELGGAVILSRSPELFFHIEADGRFRTRPMKGTVARGASPEEDARQKAWLSGSEKNQAENLMIVDLLRNDVSKLAEIGSVKVPKLFEVETYATLHQMTSLVEAQLLPDVALQDIFEAMFPCGSITGAPKIRAMQIIRSLEPDPRGAYCGAIGWINPTGEMQFNVAIRTLVCKEDGTAVLNVGGGVVYDSEAASEYAEALLKGSFATRRGPA